MIEDIVLHPSFWLVLPLIGLLFVLADKRPSWSAIAAVACYLSSTVAVNVWRFVDEKQFEAWGSGFSVNEATLVGVVLALHIWRPREGDLLAMVLWLVYLLGAAFTAWGENVNCNFWQIDPGGGTPEQGACDRIYGDYYDVIPLVLQVMAIAYFIWRYPGRLNRKLRKPR